jgi:predicted ATPase
MKGPNPFAWNPENFTVFGRKSEIGLFVSFANATSNGQPGILIVTGETGSGKSVLLRNFKHETERLGLQSIYIKVEKGEKEADLINKAFYEMKHLEDVIEYIGNHNRETIIFIDGIDRLVGADQVTKRIVERIYNSWRRRVSVVLSSTRNLKVQSDGVRNINLKGFVEQDMVEMIDSMIGDSELKVGKEFLHSVLDDSCGNQKTVFMICWYIYEKIKDNEKMITKGHYLNYLPYIMEMFSIEWFGQMYHETPKAQREILAAIAKSRDGMKVSEIAKKLKKPLGPVSTLVNRLADDGQVTRIERGRYRIISMLYGKFVLQRQGRT